MIGMIHLPQAIELHMKTEYPEIFQNFNIPLQYKFQGTECMKKDVKEYFMLFEKEDKNGISFKKYAKETNNEINRHVPFIGPHRYRSVVFTI